MAHRSSQHSSGQSSNNLLPVSTMPLEGLPKNAELHLNKLLKDYSVSSMKILLDKDEAEVEFRLVKTYDTQYYARVANWVDTQKYKKPDRKTHFEKFAKVKFVRGKAYDRVYKEGYDPEAHEPVMVPFFRQKARERGKSEEEKCEGEVPAVPHPEKEEAEELYKHASRLCSHEHVDAEPSVYNLCPDCRMMRFMNVKSQPFDKLTCAEILALNRGHKLEKAQTEIDGVEDPLIIKNLLDTKRNTYLQKVVFTTGPAHKQKLLIGCSDDVILVYDCDEEKVVHYFVKRERSQIKKRHDFYLLTQLEVTYDVGTRYKRMCQDMDTELRIVVCLLRVYAGRKGLPR